MAILGEKNLAAEMERRKKFRLNHVGTKLNEAELHGLEALAAKRGQTHGELIRGLILDEVRRDVEGMKPTAELVEIVACRLLLVNLLRPVVAGQVREEKWVDQLTSEVRRRQTDIAHKTLTEDQARH
jgi:hypothetical protein